MTASTSFHALRVARIQPDAAGAVAISLHVPADMKELFAFEPGQFLTLRAQINGQEQRRSYSSNSQASVKARMTPRTCASSLGRPRRVF